MIPESINKKALCALKNQNWRVAQDLLFYNAKKNPSHETYNNLGYYLITEGLLCANGRTRNALKLGIKYLIKASSISNSVVNQCAILESINHRLRCAKENEKRVLYKQACDCLESALSIGYSDELLYNLLRFSYILDPSDKYVSLKIRELVKNFVCEESIALYFDVLRNDFSIDEGVKCIDKHRDLLYETEILMFYARFGFFEKGYALCDSIYSSWYIDEFLASAMVECAISTNHRKEIEKYYNRIAEREENKSSGTKMWLIKIFDISSNGKKYRREKIDSYHSYSSFIDSCCYFGCETHNTKWSFTKLTNSN